MKPILLTINFTTSEKKLVITNLLTKLINMPAVIPWYIRHFYYFWIFYKYEFWIKNKKRNQQKKEVNWRFTCCPFVGSLWTSGHCKRQSSSKSQHNYLTRTHPMEQRRPKPHRFHSCLMLRLKVHGIQTLKYCGNQQSGWLLLDAWSHFPSGSHRPSIFTQL